MKYRGKKKSPPVRGTMLIEGFEQGGEVKVDGEVSDNGEAKDAMKGVRERER